MQKKKIPAPVTFIFSFIVIIGIWSLCAKIVNADLILPRPSVVVKSLKQIAGSVLFWKNFLATFCRVIISFIISVILGAFIGFLCGISSFAKDFFKFPIAIVRSTPVIAIILVAYFWFKSDKVPVFVTVLMTMPIIITSVTTGLESASPKLLKMAKVYNFSNKEIVKYVKLPASFSYFLSGCLSCFGLSWKVVAAGEVICLPKMAVGTLLQKSQMHLETSEVIAQTIILVLVSFIIEQIFFVIVQKEIKKHE